MHRLRVCFVLILALAFVGLSPVVFAQDVVPATDSGHVFYAWASVTRVDPIYQTVSIATPHQQCYQQPVERREGGSHAAGTILGAIVGGVLGNTIGKGDGRQAATAVGAVVGGAVGNKVASGNDQVVQDSVTRCQQVQDVSQEQRITGYRVEYRYHGHVYTSRLSYDPGTRLRVRVTVTPDD
ncbi:MAG TPA: glycine zipper 2TM domain-containing protein [Rhodanobacteraceae bacterium]